MAEAAVEDDRTEPGFDVFENAHNYQEDLGDFRLPYDGLKVC